MHYRSSRDAWDDPAYETISGAVGRISGRRWFMFHLRKASVGAPRVVNSHPFVVDGMAFMHNGSVKGLAHSFPASRKPLGQTDSEVYFLLLLDRLRNGGVFEAVSQTIPLLEQLDYTSLTFIMQEGNSMYAYRQFSRNGEYYTLYFAQDGNSAIFSSEPLLGLRWQLIGNRELVRASLEDSEVHLERQMVASRS